MKPYKKKRKKVKREYSGPMKHLPEETSSCNKAQLSIVFKDFTAFKDFVVFKDNDKSHILHHEE